MLWRMNPNLRTHFDFVVPLFWPWLVWNLLRLARWHARSGREALCRVDQYGNIRIVLISDPPPPDDLHVYEAPRIAAWAHPACCSDVPAFLRAESAEVRHSPDKSGMVTHGHDMAGPDPALHVPGPP